MRISITEKELPDIESLRRKELIKVQQQLQHLWDKIDHYLWFGPHNKRAEIQIQKLWNQFDNLEVIERGLLRTGNMVTRCVSCLKLCWDGRNFVDGVPLCSICK